MISHELQVAIIIPYRNRYPQLKIFLRHIHPMLKRQQLDYRIIVVEQVQAFCMPESFSMHAFNYFARRYDIMCLAFVFFCYRTA